MTIRVLVSSRSITNPAAAIRDSGVSATFATLAAGRNIPVRTILAEFNEDTHRAVVRRDPDYKLVGGQLSITPGWCKALAGEAVPNDLAANGMVTGCLVADFTDEAAASDFLTDLRSQLGSRADGVYIEHGNVPADDPMPALVP